MKTKNGIRTTIVRPNEPYSRNVGHGTTFSTGAYVLGLHVLGCRKWTKNRFRFDQENAVYAANTFEFGKCVILWTRKRSTKRITTCTTGHHRCAGGGG